MRCLVQSAMSKKIFERSETPSHLLLGGGQVEATPGVVLKVYPHSVFRDHSWRCWGLNIGQPCAKQVTYGCTISGPTCWSFLLVLMLPLEEKKSP